MVTGELLVGHVPVVLESARWLNGVHTRRALACRELRGEPGTIRQRGEIDVVHHYFWPVVRPEACCEELSHSQIGCRAVEERALVQHVIHRYSLSGLK